MAKIKKINVNGTEVEMQSSGGGNILINLMNHESTDVNGLGKWTIPYDDLGMDEEGFKTSVESGIGLSVIIEIETQYIFCMPFIQVATGELLSYMANIIEEELTAGYVSAFESGPIALSFVFGTSSNGLVVGILQ